MQAEHEKSLAALLLALGVIAALFFPEISHAAAPYLLHALFFVMVFSLLPFARFRASELVSPHPVVWALVGWQQFALPAFVLLVGYAFQIDRVWLLFILLTVTSGSLFASPTLVQLMGLDQKMAVQSVVISTLAAPISIYLTFSIVLGSEVKLDFSLFAYRLLIFLVAPIVIFCVVKLFTINWSEDAKDKLDGIGRWGSVFALIVFCFALEDEVTYAIQREPAVVLEYLAVAISVVVLVGILTRIVMARFGLRSAMTATILTSFRNVGLTFGLVGQFVGPELAVYVGVAQIPMFFSPLLFDLFVGKSRIHDAKTNPIQESKVPAVTSMTYAQAETRPAEQAHNKIDSTHTSKPVYNYYAAGNTVIASELAAGPEVTQVKSAPLPAEVVALSLNQNVQLQSDVASEDARALLQRAQLALQEASHELKRYADLDGNRSAGAYVFVFLLLCILGLTGIWHANKYFSPMLFDDKLIDRVAQAHANNQNFGVFDLNINIRDLRNATIARLPRTPEVVVLGASHWQEAHVNLMPAREFYNSHVHRDYYEDMLAVTEMWVRHNKLPKEMIITIRDNLLTPIQDRTDFLWLPGIKYYREFAARVGIKAHSRWATLPVNTWRELLSLPLLYAQAQTYFMAPVQPHATMERNFGTLDTLLPGGSILWSTEHKRLFTQERARAEALAFAKAKRNDPPKIDPIGVKHLEALFDFLKQKGVKVTLAHPQFNPIYWDAVQGSPYLDGLQNVIELTKSWSKKYGFPVIGGFSPKDVGCTADMYIDAEHGNATCLGKLLNQYPLKGEKVSLRGTKID